VRVDAPTRLRTVELLLEKALALSDASLVIYRPGVLVEFKTEMLGPGLASTRDGPHRGWQVGPLAGHHCHLDLASIDRVWFDAELVSCQGGRLNYTIWFLTTGDCGNPWRPDGLFSVTLNAPYGSDGTPRSSLIESVYALYDLHAHVHHLSASDTFLAARALQTR
jgi:hypothetical protein